jgi:hypothetical protein
MASTAVLGPLVINGFVNFFESRTTQNIAIMGLGASTEPTFFANDDIELSLNVVTAPLSQRPQSNAVGVLFDIGGITGFAQVQDTLLGGDVIIKNTSYMSGTSVGVTTTYIAGGTDGAYLASGVTNSFFGNGGVVGSGVFWGPGTLNMQDQSRFTYPSGVSGATNFFLQTGLTLNGQSVGCQAQPSDAAAPVCDVALTAAGLDSAFGGTNSGCQYLYGGGSYCNYGP